MFSFAWACIITVAWESASNAATLLPKKLSTSVLAKALTDSSEHTVGGMSITRTGHKRWNAAGGHGEVVTPR